MATLTETELTAVKHALSGFLQRRRPREVIRADLKWHRYEPADTVKEFQEFLDVVERDDYSAFFG